MITVLCGLIRNSENKIFIARRAAHKEHPGVWEFPGGKLEGGETHQECIERELMEELGMQVVVGSLAGETHHRYSKFTIHLIAYHCQFMSASYVLGDHDAYEWVAPRNLVKFPLAASDLVFARMLSETF